MKAVRTFIARIRKTGKRRDVVVSTVSMGRERIFEAWDLGDDTFVFERGISSQLDARPSLLIAAKAALGRRARGRVLTLTTGNHAVAAMPLLDGRFWSLSRLAQSRRGEVLSRDILCANVVAGKIELSQRETGTDTVCGDDEWLRITCGFGLGDVVLLERNAATLDHYRARGEEWRFKPLEWTEAGMRAALASSRRRISSRLSYYHSARGVHFLTWPELERFSALAATDPERFAKGIREIFATFEGNSMSLARQLKYRGHHEIEFFGLERGAALKKLIPAIEHALEPFALGKAHAADYPRFADEMLSLYRALLARSEYADENSRAFIDALYMHVTGEIYAVAGGGSSPAFDDRRTALPGAAFVDGRISLHPGADARTEVLLANVRALMSRDESVEYANVYELRDDSESAPLGRGKTREVVYKTSRQPTPQSLVEKRLSSTRKGYGGYVLSRIGALKSLGVTLSDYRLLRRRAHTGGHAIEYYIRRRCDGEPLAAIPKSYFASSADAAVEDAKAVLELASLMGDAAAQNMAMKKFDPASETPLFGIGKEIYDFAYDLAQSRIVPKSVATCSIRGSFGWPCTDFTQENMMRIGCFYMAHYAHALKLFQRQHSVPMADIAARFFDGFEYRTHALAGRLSVMRDQFESFDPKLPSQFGFSRKWRFLLWALDRQERRLPLLRKRFLSHVAVIENSPGEEAPVSVDDEFAIDL